MNVSLKAFYSYEMNLEIEIWRLQALGINITNDAKEPGCKDYANGLILQ